MSDVDLEAQRVKSRSERLDGRMRDIVVVGAGGHAKEVVSLIEDINSSLPQLAWHIVGLTDADARRAGRMHCGYPILGDDSIICKWSGEIAVAFGVGMPAVVSAVAQSLQRLPHVVFPNLVHPTAWIPRRGFSMGRGNTILAGNIFSCDTAIGSFNVFNRGGTYSHDLRVADFCVLSPGVNIAGRVTLHDLCYVGIGTTIIQGITVGQAATVGAGALAIRDVEPHSVVAGVPARLLRCTNTQPSPGLSSVRPCDSSEVNTA